MKKIFKMFSRLFTYKKNYFIFILSFVVIFISTFAINMNYSEIKKHETIASIYPDSLIIEDSTSYNAAGFTIENSYKNSEYFEVLKLSLESEVTNLDVSEDTLITFYGVDNNFLNFPIYRDGSEYGFNKMLFSNDALYTEDIFRLKGMFAIIPENLIPNSEINNLLICDKNVNVISTYKTVFKSSETIIILPNTTFLTLFSEYSPFIMDSIYANRFSSNEINDYVLSNVFKKENIILSTNAAIDKANVELPFYITLYLVASISVCILCVATIKNRYNEIGIKLAIGAKKTDLVLEFTVENMLIVLISSLMAFALSIFSCLTIESVKTIISGINSILIFMPISFFCLSFYLISCFVFVLLPSFVGVNSNIEKILKEER